METLRTGDKAFYNTFSGLVPCKVTQIDGTTGLAGTAQRVTVTLTATRGGFERGNRITTSGLHIVPRKSVKYRNGQAKIQAYNVEAQ